MEISFRRDLNHNYMILENPNVTGAEYTIRMLEQNRIPELLCCQRRSMNGSTYLYYEITSKQPLTQIYENQNMKSRDIEQLLFGIRNALEHTRQYLLLPEEILLQPEFIYLDTEIGQVQLCYFPKDVDASSAPQAADEGEESTVPGKKTVGGNVAESLLGELSEYILKHLDHSDRRAVELGYELFRQASMENFSLSETLKNMLQKKDGLDENGRDTVPGADQKKNEQQNREDRHPESFAEFRAGSSTGQEEYWKENAQGKETVKKKKGSYHSRKAERTANTVSGKWTGKKKNLIACALITFFLAAVFGAIVYFGKLDLTQTGGLAFLLLAVVWIIYNTVERKKQGKKKIWLEEDEEDEDLEEDYMELLMRGEELEQGLREAEVRIPDARASETKASETRMPERRGAPELEEVAETVNLCGETRCLTEQECQIPWKLLSMEPERYPDLLLKQQKTIIGKMKGQADIRLCFDSVSRVHAKMEKKGKQWFLTDLNSMNGTFVNGERLMPKEETIIQNGDKISFAMLHYTVKEP